MIKETKEAGSNETISELARDGKRITRTIIGMGGYKSISGNYLRIDSNGNSEARFNEYNFWGHYLIDFFVNTCILG